MLIRENKIQGEGLVEFSCYLHLNSGVCISFSKSLILEGREHSLANLFNIGVAVLGLATSIEEWLEKHKPEDGWYISSSKEML